MKKVLSAILFSSVMLAAQPAKAPAKAAAPAKTAPQAKSWDKLAFPKLGEVKLPEIKRYELANGLKLFLVEDHQLPLIDGRAMIRTGARWEPAEKAGLASVFGQVMRSGGTRTLTGDAMDEQLEAIAASVESGIGSDSGTASFSTLKGNEDKVLALFADMLMNPEFRQDKIDLAKIQVRAGISRRNDDVGQIAGREFRKLLYGADTPYTLQTEYWTLDAVTRADLQAWHQKYFHPNNTLLAVWGDFKADEMKARIEKAFASWRKKDRLDLPPVPQVDSPRRASMNFIRKDDVNQTNLRIGHMGGRFDDPDYFATSVMAEILCAGGFSSRLTTTIRTKMGLAYAAGGSWSADYDHAGTFSIRVDTKSESTAKAIEAILQLIREFREKEVTDEELKVAKESILNGFVFNFQGTGQIVNRLMAYEYYHYPPDFLDKYKANVEKVTKADVLRAAQRSLQPDQLVVLAVGRDKDFDKPLEKIAHGGGRVNALKIDIPDRKPGTEVAKAIVDPAAMQRGRQILARAAEFAGGAEKLKALKDMETVANAKLSFGGQSFEGTLKNTQVFPQVTRQEIVLPIATIVSFFDGNTGWSQNPGGVQNINDQQKKESLASVLRHTMNLLSGYGSPTVAFEKREGELDVLQVTKDDVMYRVFVDAQGRVVRKAYRGVVAGPPADVEETYSDFKAVDGYQIPHKLAIKNNGQPFLEAEITAVKVNAGIDAVKLGEKPK